MVKPQLYYGRQELRKENVEQRVELIFVVGSAIAQLAVQLYQLIVGGNQLSRNLAATSFTDSVTQ